MEALIIPLKLDSEAALAELRKLAAQGAEAGKSVEKGMEGAKQEAKGLGSAVGELITHQGYQLLRDAAGAMAQGYQQTADYIKSISTEFSKLQDTLRIIATFRNERATGEFTVEQARMGAAAGLTPEAWANFQKQFTGYAGQFIGEGNKFSKAQGDDLAIRAASFMNARGIDASQGGAIFGELMQQAKGDESNDVLMQRFGQAYKILEAAKGDPGQLLGQIGQVTASGMGTTDAAKLMRAMAQRDPGEAGTYSRALLRGLRDIEKEGKNASLGITEDMDTFQKIEAISKAADASGMPQDKFLSQYFKDERELGGAQAAINFGVKGGQFAAADRDAATVTGRSDAEFVQSFKAGEGRRKYLEADLAAERVAAGERYDPLAQVKLEAERQLTREGRFEDMTGIGDAVRGLIPGVPDVRQQLINERAYSIARQQAGEDSVFTGFKGFGEEQATIDRMILDTLKKIESKTADAPNRPLSAPPPAPQTRP